jgi:hypothetical protein
MSNNKLEHYVNIAKLLLENGPQTISQLKLFLKNPDNASLKRELDFLVENEIIIKQSKDNVTQRYSIAPSGIDILNFFNVIPPKQPIKTAP